MANIKIAVINKYNKLNDSDIEPVVAALQLQIHRDFAPVWGKDADLRYCRTGELPDNNEWQLVIMGSSDNAGILGIHDVTPHGLPLGKVFAGTDRAKGGQWSITASHELLEMIIDPGINLSASKANGNGIYTLYAYENCDACEDDDYAYEIHGVMVSDFVYPSWFEQFHPANTQYDFQNFIKNPFELLPKGFATIKRDFGWVQIQAPGTPITFGMRANVGTRRERRSIPRENWLPSRPDPEVMIEIILE